MQAWQVSLRKGGNVELVWFIHRLCYCVVLVDVSFCWHTADERRECGEV